MKFTSNLFCSITALIPLFFASASYAYTVDCSGGETVQDAINNIGSSDTIVIDGVCASQGVITIRQNNIRIQGAGGPANKDLNVIEGRVSLQGAQFVNINDLTISSNDNFAIAANELSNIRIFNSILNVNSNNLAQGLSLISSRALLVATKISATSSAANAVAVTSTSNAISVGVQGNSYEATAPSGVAMAIQAVSGGIAFISPTAQLQANGAESFALNIGRGGSVKSLFEPQAGQATSLIGDIQILGGAGEFNSLSQSSGNFAVIDGKLALRDAEIISTPHPIALRNGSLTISNASITIDIASFLNSVTTVEENSTVNGTLEQVFGSKVAILTSSHLENLICDKNELSSSYFTDVSSSIGNLENCNAGTDGKSKKSVKKSKKSKK